MSAAVAPVPRARWPWAIGVLDTLIGGAGLVFVALKGDLTAGDVANFVAFISMGIVAGLILSRDRRNAIGGLLLWTTSAVATAFMSNEWAGYLYEHGSRNLAAWIGWPGTSFWMIGLFPLLIFLPLLFPDGSLPSPRWRPFAWTGLGICLIAFVLVGFGEVVSVASPGAGGEDVELRNPLRILALVSLARLGGILWIGLLVLFVLSVAAMVLRYRRSAGIERQQLRWFSFAAIFLVVYFVFSSVLEAVGIAEGTLGEVISALGYLGLVAAIGVAVLQYHLWELDVVVKKTLVAGSLVVIAVLVYGAVVALIPTFIEMENPVFLFATALGLGLAFRPAMRVARRFADRLVYGRRATPYEILSDFSERLGSSYATEDVLPRMAQVLGEGAGAEVARVWLASGRELRQAGVWPAIAGTVARIAVAGDAVTGVPGETTVEVRDRGQLLGALSVRMPAADPITPTKEKLVRDLAAQAGLVLRNVRLVEDLRSSRQRLVAAQDEERRRLERNIHDGAQQQLVAVTVKARLARQFTERDPAKAAELLEQIEAETQTALEDLRDLARGIYPPLLADRGLVAALEAQTRKVPLTVTVSSDGVGRYGAEVEATVYFCTLEALQNVAKYAHATSTEIRLSQSNGTLWFTVADDGSGFDPAAVTTGSGLQGMADRLAAVGGTLDVGSSPGEGTTITGNVPVG